MVTNPHPQAFPELPMYLIGICPTFVSYISFLHDVILAWGWWHMPVIPAAGRCKPEDGGLEASQGYILENGAAHQHTGQCFSVTES